MRHRGWWDENEDYHPRSYGRSHALNDGYYRGPPQCPQWPDYGQSPNLFDSPPRRESAYYTAATNRQQVPIQSTRKPSGCPREQQSKIKRNTSEEESEANIKASETRHLPSSHKRRNTQKKERKLLPSQHNHAGPVWVVGGQRGLPRDGLWPGLALGSARVPSRLPVVTTHEFH